MSKIVTLQDTDFQFSEIMSKIVSKKELFTRFLDKIGFFLNVKKQMALFCNKTTIFSIFNAVQQMKIRGFRSGLL
jgi:hypothetical protein